MNEDMEKEIMKEYKALMMSKGIYLDPVAESRYMTEMAQKQFSKGGYGYYDSNRQKTLAV